MGLTVALVNCAHAFNGKFVETYNLHINDVTYCGILGFIYRGNKMILIIQLNLAILDELINNKSPFYDYLLNIAHMLWQDLIGGAIIY